MSRAKQMVIIGGGPAGLSAAIEGARTGMDITIVERNSTLGGQYFRGRQDLNIDGSPRRFARECKKAKILVDTVVIDAPKEGVISVYHEKNGVRSLTYDALVIATGAYDRPIALPGWTLPGVLTAGGISTLAKENGITPGKRIIVAGAGPFMLSVACDLIQKGCQVQVIEATQFSATLYGLPIIARDPEILRQALGYQVQFAARGVKQSYGRMITRIHGHNRVEAATIQQVDKDWNPIPGTDITVEIDAVCLGFGFVPSLDLAQLLNCPISYHEDTSDFYVRTDIGMRTQQPQIYAAGEITGIGGVRMAVTEGHIAGLTVALDLGLINDVEYQARTQKYNNRLVKYRRLAEWLRITYRPRLGLWSLPEPSTILCRCEDVRMMEIEAATMITALTPFAIKTATRAGMGLCQGRICGNYMIEWLRARHGYIIPTDAWPWRVRPPLWPVRMGDWLLSEDS